MRRLVVAGLFVVAGCAAHTAPGGPFPRAGVWAQVEASGRYQVVQTVPLLGDPAAPGRDAVTFEHHGHRLALRLVSAVERPPPGAPQHAVLEVNGVTATFEREVVYEVVLGEPGDVLLLAAMDVESREGGAAEADLVILHPRR